MVPRGIRMVLHAGVPDLKVQGRMTGVACMKIGWSRVMMSKR